MKYLIFVLCALQAKVAFADTKVIFFGGHGATQGQMNCWVAGAQRQKRWAGYKFSAFPYPNTSDFSHPAVIAEAAKSEIDSIVAEINSHPNTHYILMGHSSGAAVSDAIAERITKPSHAELINIEGFAPSPHLQERMKTLCVYSDTTRTKEEIAELRYHDAHLKAGEGRDLNRYGNLVSSPASSMKNCAHSVRVPVHHCKSTHCLHFSLVNLSSPDELHYDYKTNGYNGCHSNLTYLHELHQGETQTADGEYDAQPEPRQQQQQQQNGESST